MITYHTFSIGKKKRYKGIAIKILKYIKFEIIWYGNQVMVRFEISNWN